MENIQVTSNDLGLLGSVEVIPNQTEIDSYNAPSGEKHQVAKDLLANNQVIDAWKVLLA